MPTFTYIAYVGSLGASEFRCGSIAALVQDMTDAHGKHAPTAEEIQQITKWAVDARPGDILSWRLGWVICSSSNRTEVKS